jgi:hypothetical protein
MARKPTPREYFFIGVLAVIGIVYLLYRDEGRLFGGGQEEQKKRGPMGIAPIVRLAQLAAEPEDYDPRGRNLFEYYTPPPPPRKAPPKPKPVVRKPPDVNQQRLAAQRMKAQAVQQPQLRPPNINFKYLGYLGPKTDKIAVFEHGEEMVLVREGEVVEKDFLLVEFKYESVVMGYVDTKFKGMTTELNMARN